MSGLGSGAGDDQDQGEDHGEGHGECQKAQQVVSDTDFERLVKLDTESWLERAVIGLNLCPFAQKVWRDKLVRLTVYGGDSQDEALETLAEEIKRLAQNTIQNTLKKPLQNNSSQTASPELHASLASPDPADPADPAVPHLATRPSAQTTLLILPKLCVDFWDFLSLVQAAQRVLKAQKCVGVLQIAHFHPQYQFAHTQESDPENLINRSPYPTLHLLREEDIEWAAQTHPDVSLIYQANVQRMNEMGHAAWAALGLAAHRTPQRP